MNWRATIANSLWIGSSLPQWHRFRHALNRPAEVQRSLLRQLLASNSGCAYGRNYNFQQIRDYVDFANRVPLKDYENLAPWIDRIRQGEKGILTSAPVTHLIPTSGSIGARKLIPFTSELQKQFDCAIGPWIAELALAHPQILAGPAYWSITPPPANSTVKPSEVPIGFADDASYLGGVKSRLVRAAMVGPDQAAIANDPGEFQVRTLLCLLEARDLRLISVWHPSFLSLLLDALPVHWERILAQISLKNRGRVRELERASPSRPETLWPNLKVISCWGDGHAKLPLADLQRRFPDIAIQAKGLLATEAFMTIPYAGRHPVAICSHFFEYVDSQGQVHPVEELRADEIYEVIVTTAGGLWRYRMHDQVGVTGFVGKTPSLQFIGRTGNVSDLFGEKLSESFVADVIQNTFALSVEKPRFALLAPDQDAAGWHYTLYVEGPILTDTAEVLDRNLRQNLHYSHCRDLGQLLPVTVVPIKSRGYESFVKRLVSEGKRLGDIKPAALSCAPGWSKVFEVN